MDLKQIIEAFQGQIVVGIFTTLGVAIVTKLVKPFESWLEKTIGGYIWITVSLAAAGAAVFISYLLGGNIMPIVLYGAIGIPLSFCSVPNKRSAPDEPPEHDRLGEVIRITVVLLLAVLSALVVVKVIPQENQIFVSGVEVSVEVGEGKKELFQMDIEEPIPAKDIHFSDVTFISCAGDTLYALDEYGAICAINGDSASLLDTAFRDDDSDATIVHAAGGDIYFLTEKWDEKKGDTNAIMVSFARIRDGVCSLIGSRFEVGYVTTSLDHIVMMDVVDFAVDSNRNIWYLLRYENQVDLQRIPYDEEQDSYGQAEIWKEFPKKTEDAFENAGMCFDEYDNLYFSAPEDGWIYVIPSEVILEKTDPNEPEVQFPFVFAGEKQEENTNSVFRDALGDTAEEPIFYYPTSLACHNGFLYVWDWNTVRRVRTKRADVAFPACGECETLAGIFYPKEREHGAASGSGNAVKFSSSEEARITVRDDGVLFLSDPRNGLVYRIASS